MKRRAVLAGLVSGVALAGPALAGDVIDSIVRQLKRQGFRSVVQERTLLGRVRILAKRKDGTREIIVNPRTGEILRDLWTPLNGVASEAPIIKEPDGRRGSGSGSADDDDHDDDDDDDHDDDDDDDDNDSSNSGSGSSGSGSSGSSDDDDDDDDDDD